ncbi:MAG: SCP-like extracellular [Ruminococcus sp.]|nr:SCP-like extracellular [Ruminococcus sp.]
MSTMKYFLEKVSAVMVAFTMLFCMLASFPTEVVAEDKENKKDFAAMCDEMAVLINEKREEAGLAPLLVVPYLCDIANIRAVECTRLFSHDRPSDILDYRVEINGEKYFGFDTAIDVSIVPFMWAGENLAAGNSSVEATYMQWENSEGHRKNIFNPNYTHIGIAVVYKENDPDNLHYYWTTLFIGCGIELKNQYLPETIKERPVSSGDINGDGEINSFDLITLNKYLAGMKELNKLQLESADMLKDGTVNSDDADVLAMYILGECDTLPITAEMLLKMLKERK